MLSRKESSQAARLTFWRMEKGAGMSTQDVEGEPAQDSKIFRAVVLPGPAAVLGEDDVEYPMELVLDAQWLRMTRSNVLAGIYLERR